MMVENDELLAAIDKAGGTGYSLQPAGTNYIVSVVRHTEIYYDIPNMAILE
jgi:hypothetical protein